MSMLEMNINGHLVIELFLFVGLNRSGKSCRMRWLNYLRPSIKRGHISSEEEQIIIHLQKQLGNR